VKARELFREIAEAAWECADPGLQFDTTINAGTPRRTPAGSTARTRAASTCTSTTRRATSRASTCCVPRRGRHFDVDGFKAAVEVVFTAQEILVGNADYPTEKIGETTRRFRQLGIGYANLGAMLMALGLPTTPTRAARSPGRSPRS
jgi:ribonucleoside-diphosphate reductase alpha chain